MRNSLVLRLSVLIALVITVAFAILVLIVHWSTSRTFVNVQREVLARELDRQPEIEFGSEIETAFKEGGWPAVESTVKQTPDGEVAAIVMNTELEVAAATAAELTNATVRQDESGTLAVTITSAVGGQVSEMDVSVTNPLTLRGPGGNPFGYLVILPSPRSDRPPADGDSFAREVWKSAALWLGLTILGAMLATALLIRRSLRPLTSLTMAARKLQNGEIPKPLPPSGDAEFDRLIQAFNSATRTLAETENIRRQLVTDIAHELRTPLTNIIGQVEAAESGLLDAGDEFYDTLRAETRVLQRLVQDFQQLAVSDAGQLKLNLCELPLLESLQNMVTGMTERRTIDWQLAIPPELTISADEERLRQVFGNLVENAIRHQPTGLSIQIQARNLGERVKIQFTDNGPGICPKHVPYVFDRFYRADKSRNRATGGSGLGLAIVRNLMTAMGGSIRYCEEHPSGARFELVFPTGERSTQK